MILVGEVETLQLVCLLNVKVMTMDVVDDAASVVLPPIEGGGVPVNWLEPLKMLALLPTATVTVRLPPEIEVSAFSCVMAAVNDVSEAPVVTLPVSTKVAVAPELLPAFPAKGVI